MATKKTAPKQITSSKVAPKKKIVSKDKQVSGAPKKASIHHQIEVLEQQIYSLNQEAAEDLKQALFAARKVVSDLEDDLEELAGKPPAGKRKGKRTRRVPITDEALQAQVLAAMVKFGKAGLNAKQLAEMVGQDALRVRKFIAANAKTLKRVGRGPGTKFHLP